MLCCIVSRMLAPPCQSRGASCLSRWGLCLNSLISVLLFLWLLSLLVLISRLVLAQEELLFELLQAVLHLRANRRFKAVQQVLLQVVNCVHFWRTVVLAHPVEQLQDLHPLLRLCVHKHQRIEKLARHENLLIHQFRVNLLHHFHTGVLSVLALEVLEHAGHFFAH